MVLQRNSRRNSRLLIVAVVAFGCASCFGQSPQQAPLSYPAPATAPATAPTPAPADQQIPAQRLSGSISGTVLDESGAVVAGAHVRLTVGGSSASQYVLSGENGQYSFADVPPGPFQITITAPKFAPQTLSGILHAGESYIVSTAALAVATAVTDVEVRVSQIEVAEEQIKVEEKQRVLGVLPNFYVSYIPDAAPLTRSKNSNLRPGRSLDPFTLVFVGGSAGLEQAQNHFRGYGQGAQGYAKRFGAGYGDTTFGDVHRKRDLAIAFQTRPAVFLQGNGQHGSRFLYAIANAFICKGDNKRWQPNYSGMLGSLAAGGISNLYYPAEDRNGVGLTFENAAIGIGASGIANLFQEFVIRKLTPKAPHNDPAKP